MVSLFSWHSITQDRHICGAAPAPAPRLACLSLLQGQGWHSKDGRAPFSPTAGLAVSLRSCPVEAESIHCHSLSSLGQTIQNCILLLLFKQPYQSSFVIQPNNISAAGAHHDFLRVRLPVADWPWGRMPGPTVHARVQVTLVQAEG